MNTTRPTPTSRWPTRRARRPALGVRHRGRRRPGRDHLAGARRRRPGRPGRLLPDARRRRADLRQRLPEWVSNAPELEEDVALANTALDLLGQARVLLARAGHVEEHRPAADATRTRWPICAPRPEFRNVALAELPDDLDFARAVARLLLFSSWRLALLHAAARLPGPGAGRGRRQGRQGADLPPRLRRPLDAAARRRHRRVAPADAGRAGRGVAVPRGAVPRARTSSAGWPRPGWRSTRSTTRDEVDAVLDEVLDPRHADPPDDPADRHHRRPRRPAGPAHRTPRARARRDAEPGPPAPGCASGDLRRAAVHARTTSAERGRARRRPGDADAHAGRPGRGPRRSRPTATRSP